MSAAAKGAKTLKMNMNTLYENVGLLNVSVGELNEGVRALFDGTGELKKGTSEFVRETENLSGQAENEINSIAASVTGEDVETVSFISEKNTDVESVQFVIKSEAVKITEKTAVNTKEESKLNFWQKLLRLFGIKI